jgi:hypothetical protein
MIVVDLPILRIRVSTNSCALQEKSPFRGGRVYTLDTSRFLSAPFGE